MGLNREKTLQAAEKQINRGNFDKAMSLYQDLVDDDPKDLRMKLKVADLYSRMGDVKRAIRTYLEVGSGYETTQDYDKAAAIYKVAHQAAPKDLSVTEALGSLYAKMGRTKEALQLLSDVYLVHSKGRDQNKAQLLLEKMSNLDPDNVGLKIQLAERFQKQNNTARALSCFHEAADVLRGEGRRDELFQVMQRILYLAPDSLEARKEVIKGLLERGEEQRALKHFRTAVTNSPDDIELLTLLAATFEKLDQIEHAVEVYDKLINLYGGDSSNPTVSQLEDYIIQIGPDTEIGKRVFAQKYPEEAAKKAKEGFGFVDLMSGDDLMGERDILDDVEFLDDPFADFANEHVNVSTSLDFNAIDVASLRASANPELDRYANDGFDDAPTQPEDAEGGEDDGRHDVVHMLRRVESFFQFNLLGQADELTRDIVKIAPDNFYARELRLKLCELLGKTEEEADQLMEMARLTASDPRVSSQYLGKALTRTGDPARFESYAESIRQEWAPIQDGNLTQIGPRLKKGEPPPKATFALPKPTMTSGSGLIYEDGQVAHQVEAVELGEESTSFETLEEVEPAAMFEEMPLNEAFNAIGDLHSIPVIDDAASFFDSTAEAEGDEVGALPEKEAFDFDFLDENHPTIAADGTTSGQPDEGDKFAKIFSDIDLELSQFGNQSLSAAFLFGNRSQVEEKVEEAAMPTQLELGVVYYQTGRHDEAIEILEPLLEDPQERIAASILLADVYTDLENIPAAAENLLRVINDESSTLEQREEAQEKLRELS